MYRVLAFLMTVYGGSVSTDNVPGLSYMFAHTHSHRIPARVLLLLLI